MVSPSLSTSFASASSSSTKRGMRAPTSPAATASVQVVVRVRPLNDREKKHGTLPVVSASTSDKTVTVIKGTGSRQIKSSYKFDNVFTSFSTQEDVFEATLQPIIRDVLMGYESTVFAYGQTGTGKTHTMEGDLSQADQHGVIPRSAAAIFDALNKNPEYTSSAVYCSLLEIYNEELSDLLVVDNGSTCGNTKSSKRGGGVSSSKSGNAAATKLAIMEGEHGPFCRGLSETKVTSASDLLALMQTAHQQRQTGETLMNKESSRSHCIFTLRVEAKRQLVDGSVLEVGGKLHCVDLAGSECAKSCGNAGKQQAARERERMNINRSLLTLGRVVKLLKERSQQSGSGGSSVRIPYRDSKLTRILQESLGGRCKTCLIATISPSVTAIEESMSTLNYAQAANGIINKPVTTSLMTVGGGSSFAFDGSNKSSAEGAGGAAGTSIEHWHEMECRLEYMQSQVEEAQQALARKHIQQQELVERAEQAEMAKQLAERNFEKATHEISILERKVEEITEQLEETENSLRDTRIILGATQQTEDSLTKEATALIQVLKTTIKDGDNMHQELLEKRKEELDRKAATKDYKAKQISLLNELLQHLELIEETQQRYRVEIESANKDHSSRELELLQNHSTVVKQIKKNCVSEIEAFQKSTKNNLLPIVHGLVSSAKEKLDALSAQFKHGDEILQSRCQSVLSRLSENCNAISKLESAYLSSSESVLDTLATQLEASKENLSTAVAEITAKLEEDRGIRQIHRDELVKSMGTFQSHCHTSIDQMKHSTAFHTATLNKFVEGIKENQLSRSNTLQSLSSMNGYLKDKNAEYVKKLEHQCSVLKEQHEALVAAHQRQQKMNKALVTNVMSGMQSLVEKEMRAIDQFQSDSFGSLLAANEKSKDSNAAIHQTSLDVFDYLGTTNGHLENDIRNNFNGQDQLGSALQQESSAFDANMKTSFEGLRNPIDTFANETMNTLQSLEKEDLNTTESIIHTTRLQVETATNQSASRIQEGAKKGISSLNESTEQGWKYVKEEVLDTVRNDLCQIQGDQSQVCSASKESITGIGETLDADENAASEQIRKGQEYISLVEKHLEDGIDGSFAGSVDQHREHIEDSQWLETALQKQVEAMGGHLCNSKDAVSMSSKQLENLAHNIHRLHEEPVDIPCRNIPEYSESLTFTKDPQAILRESQFENSDCGESSKENTPMTSKDSALSNNLHADKKKVHSTSQKGAVLNDRSGSLNSQPTPTSRMKNIRLNANESPPLKRTAAENNVKTGIPCGLRKRSKRTKVSQK